MPWGRKRYYGTLSLHFITWSCYRVGCPILSASFAERVGGKTARSTNSRIPGPRNEAPNSRKEREKWGTRRGEPSSQCIEGVVHFGKNSATPHR